MTSTVTSTIRSMNRGDCGGSFGAGELGLRAEALGLRLSLDNVELCVGQIDRIPTDHDGKCAGFDDAVHVTIQK